MINFEEEKLFILTQDNKVFSYGYTPGMDLQPMVDFFKKTEKLAIAELYIQQVEGKPMINVTDKYRT